MQQIADRGVLLRHVLDLGYRVGARGVVRDQDLDLLLQTVGQLVGQARHGHGQLLGAVEGRDHDAEQRRLHRLPHLGFGDRAFQHVRAPRCQERSTRGRDAAIRARAKRLRKSED